MQAPIEFFVEINRENIHFVCARNKCDHQDAERFHKYVVTPAWNSAFLITEPTSGRAGMSLHEFEQWIESLESAGHSVDGPIDIA